MFRDGLLQALRVAVPCDWISLNEVGADAESTFALVDPPMSAAAHEIYGRHALDNPLVSRYARTQDGRAYRFSDVATVDELQRTELWQHFYGPIGLNHQIAFTLPHDPERIVAVVLSRRDDDFTDDEGTLKSWSLSMSTGENGRTTDQAGGYNFNGLLGETLVNVGFRYRGPLARNLNWNIGPFFLNDVYFQVGLLTTVGLTAKTAILIVEFAEGARREGKKALDSALEAARGATGGACRAGGGARVADCDMAAGRAAT